MMVILELLSTKGTDGHVVFYLKFLFIVWALACCTRGTMLLSDIEKFQMYVHLKVLERFPADFITYVR